MGEYAEMMLDGTCCACCGEYLGTDAGFPIYCGGCARDFDQQPLTGLPLEKPRKRKGPAPGAKPCVCGTCGKSFKSKGARRQHRKQKHPAQGMAPEGPRPKGSGSSELPSPVGETDAPISEVNP